MKTEEVIRLSYPLPLAKVFEAVRLESDARLRIDRLVKFFEELLRYLSLVGLASYAFYGLNTAKVEAVRPDLARPTLGHWLQLLSVVTKALRPNDRHFLRPPLSQKYQDGEAIALATQALRQVLGKPPLQQVTLDNFLSELVAFRNAKIGHGTLTPAEARFIRPHLEQGLNQWLAALSPLKERHLVFIEHVEFRGPTFLYTGINLNSGTSLYPANLLAEDKVLPQRLYWHVVEAERYVPLPPYFSFDPDTRLVYVYRGLSSSGQPELFCPYEAAGPYQQIELPAGAGAVISSTANMTTKKPASEPKTDKKRKPSTAMHNWFDIIKPHADIRRGEFDEAVFAADLGDVYAGTARADYNDPYLFFQKTYLTAGLGGLLRRVQAKLAEGRGASVVQIQTPFGGGKTHALVALYHYLKHGERVKPLLPQGLKLLSPHVVVVAGNHWDPVSGTTGEGPTRYTFWGELAYQLGGPAGYESMRENDEARISPGKEKLRHLLEQYQPFILLFDEILEYINRALDKRDQLEGSLGTQTFSFFQELTETVASLPEGMLVVTLPSSHLEDFGDREEESLARLGKIFGRLETIETPVQGEEVYEVIRRRLFDVDTLKQQPMREIVYRTFQLYQENQADLPPKARDVNLRDKMEMAYPFHPDVIDILYEKWSTFSSFQRTRGVLRLLASVVEDLYQQEANLDLILPGDINLDRPSIRQEFLKHIGAEYEGVIASDIAGHEAKAPALDSANRQWKHLSQRISTAIFYHSFTAADSGKGVTLPYVKLAVLRSETLPALVTDVLQKLSNTLWYLNSRGETHFFSRIPNLNRMILDKKELFNEDYEEALKAVIEKEIGRRFRTYVWPRDGDEIRDNRELKLVILHPNDSGANIATWIDNKGQSFRDFKGTLFFALAEAGAFAQLREDIKTHLALLEIEAEVKGDAASPLVAKQQEIRDRKYKIERDFSYKVRRMYHVLQIGERRIDLQQPVTGSESLDSWYWRELTSGDIGAIVVNLHYNMLVSRIMAGNEQVATGVILDQFYKDTQLPAPASPEVVARAIQLGVQEGALGLVMAGDGEISPEMVRFNEVVPLNLIAFEPGFYVLSREKAQALLAEIAVIEDNGQAAIGGGPGPAGDDSFGGDEIGGGAGEDDGGDRVTGEQTYGRVRLVISDVPASRIADVNRGIFLPLARKVDNLKFTLELDVTSDEGIPQSELENKIKETIRQIGATLRDEELDVQEA